MLLGCCHCPGDSTQQSDSFPPSSGSSGSSASIETIPASCGVCSVVPRRWKISITGWTGVNADHDSCCGSLNADFIIYNYTLPPFSTSCVVYRSDELAKDQRTVPTPCTGIGTRRLILAQLDNNFPALNSSLTVGISVATGTGSPTTYQNEVFSITFSNAASCLVGGMLDYVTENGTGPLRCIAGATITATPI
jgi:hypothetical protein